MANVQNIVGHGAHRIGAGLEGVVRSRWAERLARFGFFARSAVYGTVGVLALQAAAGAGGRATGEHGALHAIAAQPFGQFLLFAVALGLIGYSLWRFGQALFDLEGKGSSAKALAERAGFGLNGVAHVALALAAFNLALGNDAGGDPKKEWTARLLAMPAGPLLVGLVGAFAVAYGVYQLRDGLTGHFMKNLRASAMSAHERRITRALGRVGLAARGVIFVLTGVFFFHAAAESNAKHAKGLDGALQEIASKPFGPWLLGLTALGLIAFAVYSFFAGRYRHLTPSGGRALAR